MLFPKNTLSFNPEWAAARPVQLGQNMGTAV